MIGKGKGVWWGGVALVVAERKVVGERNHQELLRAIVAVSTPLLTWLPRGK